MKCKWLTLFAVAALALSLTACGNKPADEAPAGDTTTDPTEQAISGKLTKDDAKEKALAHAGLKEEELNFIDVDYEEDDNAPVFNVEFRASGTEYDYEIDGNTGEVLEYDTDRNNMSIDDKRTALSNPLTVEDVTNIVLEAAELTMDGIEYLDVDLDVEGGKGVYNVEFRHAENDYDYEVDAVSGEILESSKEPVGK